MQPCHVANAGGRVSSGGEAGTGATRSLKGEHGEDLPA